MIFACFCLPRHLILHYFPSTPTKSHDTSCGTSARRVPGASCLLRIRSLYDAALQRVRLSDQRRYSESDCETSGATAVVEDGTVRFVSGLFAAHLVF